MHTQEDGSLYGESEQCVQLLRVLVRLFHGFFLCACDCGASDDASCVNGCTRHVPAKSFISPGRASRNSTCNPTPHGFSMACND